ncbi:family 16 glycosylhydrolase [bacterium]|nr:family 16 glycosylhydrolase [bacterium]
MNCLIRQTLTTTLLIVLCVNVQQLSAQRGWVPTYGPDLNPPAGEYREITCLAVNSKGHVYAGTAYDGVYRSTDHGYTWDITDSSLIGTNVTCIGINDRDWVFIGGLGQAHRSTDDGQSWTRVWEDSSMVWGFAFDADTTYMAAWTSLYRFDGLADTAEYTGHTLGNIRAIAISMDKLLYAAYELNDSVYVDTIHLENGALRNSFGKVAQTGMPILAVHEPDFIYLGGSSGIFRSQQDNADWTAVNEGLLNMDVRALCVDHDTVYAGTNGGGVFMSLNHADSWTEINDGLCDPDITALCSDGNGYLYAGTRTKGVYRSSSIPPDSACEETTWRDDFNGPEIDSNIWTFDIGTGVNGWGNNEQQYYTDRNTNARIEDTVLVIEAHHEDYNGRAFTSARLKTQGLKCMKYGCVSVRARVPQVQGAWSAAWMLGTSFPFVAWPACGEIDIMEHINTSDNVHGAMHWWDTCQADYGGTTGFDPGEWHVYTVFWDQESIIWILDGVQYHIANIKDGINGTAEFHRPFFVILNLAIGGNWPGFDIDTSQFPVRYEIDYVSVDTCSSPPITSDIITPVPQRSMLQSLYPNPAAGKTNVSFQVAKRGNVRFTIYDMLGRAVQQVRERTYEPGHHVQDFDVSTLQNGTYICRMDIGEVTQSRLMTVLK